MNEENFDPNLPLSQAKTLPSRWYTDETYFKAERERCFRRSWQLAGRRDQLNQPGDFFTTEVSGERVLVVMGEDGQPLALSNVCRHRGARVACEASGSKKRFRCRYHGWNYQMDGKLAGTPEFQGAENFNKSEIALPQFPLVTVGPWLFVKLSASSDEAFDTTYPEFVRQLPELNLDRYRFHSQQIDDIQCNWKVYVDNYLDGGYHIRTIHPDLSSVVESQRYESRVYEHSNVQISPLSSNPNHPDISSLRAGETAFYWWLYPNFMFNWYEDGFDTNLVIPTSPTTCRVVLDFYFSNPDAKFQKESLRVAEQIQSEDRDICEDAYRGVLSSTFDTGRFSPQREATGYHFHQRLFKDASSQG